MSAYQKKLTGLQNSTKIFYLKVYRNSFKELSKPMNDSAESRYLPIYGF